MNLNHKMTYEEALKRIKQLCAKGQHASKYNEKCPRCGKVNKCNLI